MRIRIRGTTDAPPLRGTDVIVEALQPDGTYAKLERVRSLDLYVSASGPTIRAILKLDVVVDKLDLQYVETKAPLGVTPTE